VAARFWNVPNSLSVGRLALTVAICALIGHTFYAWALGVFILAAITDALDGYFARLLKQETDIGRQLDPLVDKVIVSAGLIYLVAIPRSGLAPWMVTAIVSRELIVQALRSLIEGRGEAFGARLAGKLKTTFQCLAICAILLSLSVGPISGLIVVRDILIWAAVALTLYSGFGYVLLAMPKLRAAGLTDKLSRSSIPGDSTRDLA
jgi:CDP-diacylglycerol--glycerol-3-phosphate 3-phosphatidyltransferase